MFFANYLSLDGESKPVSVSTELKSCCMVNSKLDISINFYLPKMHSQVVCEPEKHETFLNV